MIKLTEFMNIPNNKVKIKFNMNPSDPNKKAWDLLLEDSDEWLKMNEWKTKQTNNNLGDAEYLVTFAQYYPYGANYYVFGGIYKVEKIMPEIFDDRGYKLDLTNMYQDYIKRLIIRLDKPIGRDIYTRLYSNVQQQLNPEVYEVAPSTKIGDFPGYNNVLLTHTNLQTIINNEAPEWKQALSKVKGIYVITDKSTGQLYIGSASGNNEGIWQRWLNYANIKNLTGGNKAFENMKKDGKDYIINNFTYSILEIFDMKTDRDYIIGRENYWKKVFQTIKYGMNCN